MLTMARIGKKNFAPRDKITTMRPGGNTIHQPTREEETLSRPAIKLPKKNFHAARLQGKTSGWEMGGCLHIASLNMDDFGAIETYNDLSLRHIRQKIDTACIKGGRIIQ